MANPLTYTNTFSDGQTVDIGVEIQENFDDITTLVNGSLNGDNLAATADLDVYSLAASTYMRTPLIEAKGSSNIEMNISNFGGSKLKVTDSDDTVLFEIDANNEVVI